MFNQIDSIVTAVDLLASKGSLDTLRRGLLNEGGTTSDIFMLKQGQEVQKISVVNKLKYYSEAIIFKNGKPIFAQFVQRDGAKWTFYLIGETAFFKNGDRFNKGSSSYWGSTITAYLDMFEDQIIK